MHPFRTIIPTTLAFTLIAILSTTFPLSAQTPAGEPAAAASAESATTVTAETEEEVVEEVVIPSVPLADRFAQGGWIMWVLLGLSFIMGTFALERLGRLRRSTILTPGLAAKARAAWNPDDTSQLAALAKNDHSVLGAAIRILAAHPNLPANDASTLVGDEVARMMRRQLQRAYPLAIVATLAPLLGLLGTVIGMIDSFEVVAIAGSLGDASLLAGGISKALVTTAFGLIVAIPALGLYHHFRSRTHELSLEVEENVNELLADWFYSRLEKKSQ